MKIEMQIVNMEFTIKRQFEADFEDVVAAVEDALADEGFGILTEADMQAVFAEDVDPDFPRYRILGACNAPLANEALEAEMAMGALLPCNVVVYEDEPTGVTVEAIHPDAVLGMADVPALDDVAAEASERIGTAVESVDDYL